MSFLSPEAVTERTVRKMSKYGVVSGPYFPVFSVNTGKYGPEITPYLDTFHAVGALKNRSFEGCGQKPSEIMKEFSFLTKTQTSGLQNIVQSSEFRNSYFHNTFFFRSLLVVNFLSSSQFPFLHDIYLFMVKDTHRKKAPSNKTPAFTKKMNMGIWVLDTSNQLFI